jgi:hypothetical protein
MVVTKGSLDGQCQALLLSSGTVRPAGAWGLAQLFESSQPEMDVSMVLMRPQPSSVCLYICLPACLSVCLFISLSVCLSVCL